MNVASHQLTGEDSSPLNVASHQLTGEDLTTAADDDRSAHGSAAIPRDKGLVFPSPVPQVDCGLVSPRSGPLVALPAPSPLGGLDNGPVPLNNGASAGPEQLLLGPPAAQLPPAPPHLTTSEPLSPAAGLSFIRLSLRLDSSPLTKQTLGSACSNIASPYPFRRSLCLALKLKGPDKSTLQKAQDLICKKLKLPSGLPKSNPGGPVDPDNSRLTITHLGSSSDTGSSTTRAQIDTPLSVEEVRKIRMDCGIMDVEPRAPTDCGIMEVEPRALTDEAGGTSAV